MDSIWEYVESGKKWANRNRNKLIGAAVAGSVLYVGYRYFLSPSSESKGNSRKGIQSEKEMRSLFDMR